MRKCYSFLAITLVAVLALSCKPKDAQRVAEKSPGSKTAPNSDDASSDSDFAESDEPQGTTLTDPELVGTWWKTCNESAEKYIEFRQDGKFARVTAMFADKLCKGENTFIATIHGTFNVGQATKRDKLPNTAFKRPFDATVNYFSISPSTAEAAQAMNQQNLCGHSDWRARVPLPIEASNKCAQEASPSKQFLTIMAVKGTGGLELYTASSGAPTADKRVTKLRKSPWNRLPANAWNPTVADPLEIDPTPGASSSNDTEPSVNDISPDHD